MVTDPGCLHIHFSPLSFQLSSYIVLLSDKVELQITTVDEAKQFYPLFGLGANVALVFSGRTVKYFSNLRKNLPPGVDGWAISLKGMMGIVVLLGLIICAIYWSVNTFVLTDPSLPKPAARKKKVRVFLFSAHSHTSAT